MKNSTAPWTRAHSRTSWQSCYHSQVWASGRFTIWASNSSRKSTRILNTSGRAATKPSRRSRPEPSEWTKKYRRGSMIISKAATTLSRQFLKMKKCVARYAINDMMGKSSLRLLHVLRADACRSPRALLPHESEQVCLDASCAGRFATIRSLRWSILVREWPCAMSAQFPYPPPRHDSHA